MKMTKSPKENAAIYAAEKLKRESYILFGSGSTVDLVISHLARVHKSLMNLKVVSASNSTSKQLSDNAIQEISILELQKLTKKFDVICVDGADEIVFDNNQQAKVILKGHGAALVREKILWEQGGRTLVVVDSTKLSSKITKYIPVEIIPFAASSVAEQIKNLFPDVKIKIRKSEDETLLTTDNNNNILEIHHNNTIDDFPVFHKNVKQITGVVETGIFADKYIKNVSYIIGYKDKVDFIS